MTHPLDLSPKLIHGKPLKHATVVPPRYRERARSVTVCIAAMINWIYPDKQIGRAIIAVADRMLTSGDIEYEPPQFKIAFLRKRIIALVSGDITVHSEAVTRTQRQLASDPTDDVEQVADLYAAAISETRRRRAATQYLLPLNLDEQSFLSKQKDMLPQLVYDITNQMQEYSINVETLIAGCDERLAAHLFHIDGEGAKTFQHDINFAAIGIGSDHAKSQFMVSRYPKIVNYYKALPILYTAKRRAEVAPGVGKESDWLLITRDGAQFIYSGLIDELEKAYDEFQTATQAKLTEVEARLAKVMEEAVAKTEIPTADQQPAEKIDLDRPPLSRLSEQSRDVTD